MVPTLIIGLGGAGFHTFTAFIERESSSKNPNNLLKEGISHLCIDTDNHQAEYMDFDNHVFSKYGFNIGRFDVVQFVSYASLNDPNLKEWWDCNITSINTVLNQLYNGAGMVRRNGRLGLYYFYSGIRKVLHRSILQTQAIFRQNDKLDIVIVSSLCGGTGSGIFFDIACLVRSILGNYGLNGKLIGIFFLPDIFEYYVNAPIRLDNGLQANTYASLIELAYYESRKIKYIFGPKRERIELDIERTFDSIWLIGLKHIDETSGRNIKDYYIYAASKLINAIEEECYQRPELQCRIPGMHSLYGNLPNNDKWKFAYELIKRREENPSPHNDKRFDRWLNNTT